MLLSYKKDKIKKTTHWLIKKQEVLRGYAYQGYREDFGAMVAREGHLLRFSPPFTHADDKLIVGLWTRHDVNKFAVGPLRECVELRHQRAIFSTRRLPAVILT